MNAEIRPAPGGFESLLVMLYGFAVITLFGVTLLDMVYAATIRDAIDPAQAAPVFSEVSDFLLLVVGATVLAALTAIGGAWQVRAARNLLLASGASLVVLLLAPAILSPWVLDVRTGLWLRLLLNASTSVLGLLGLCRFYSARS
jgi:hypothetical protein